MNAGSGPGKSSAGTDAREIAPGDADRGVDRVLSPLEVLRLLPRDETRYSEEEEREVIKRLKAFGYL